MCNWKVRTLFTGLTTSLILLGSTQQVFAQNKVCAEGSNYGLSIRGANKNVINLVPKDTRWCGTANYSRRYSIEFVKGRPLDYVEVTFYNGTKGFVAKKSLFAQP